MSKVQGDIGVRIGLSEEELQRGIARVSESLSNLAKTVEQLGKRIDQAMEQATDGAQKAARTTKELAQEEKKATGAVEEHAQAQKRLTDEQKKASQASRDQKKALEDLKQGLSQISAAAGIASAALAALAKVSGDAYQELQSAFLGLDAVAERTIGDTQAARAAAESLVEDGLMSIAEASKGLQNLLMAGFGLPEAVELMKAFKDAAAFNRQAALGFGEAVVTATEGIKNGNSILVDNAGITKNLSVILQEAGRSAQDLQHVQSDAAVRQALYNGLLKEAAIFAGNAAKSADTLAGAEARAATEAFNAKAAFGEALAPAMQALAEATTAVMGKIGDFVEANPDLVRSAFLIVGGITALTAAVGGLAVAFMSLNFAIGPTGWLILGASAAAGGLGGVAMSAKLAADEAERNARATVELAGRYKELERVLSSTTATAEERKKAEEELKRVKAELGDLMPELVTKWDAEGKAIELNTQKLEENTEAILRNQQVKNQANLESIRSQIKALERQREDLQRQIDMADQKFSSAQRGLFSEPSGMGFGDLTGGFFTKSKDQLQRELAEVNRQLAVLERRRAELEFIGPPVPPGFKPSSSGDGKDASGGRGSDKVAAALRLLEHRRTMEQITPIEYIAGLEEIKRTYEVTAEQIMDIDERIFRTKKQLAEEEIKNAEAVRKAQVQEALKLLDHERNMGWLSTQQEAERLSKMLETFELTQEERWSIEERLSRAVDQMIADQQAEAEKAAEERAQAEEVRVRAEIDRINHLKAMGELSREDEIAALAKHLAVEADYYERHTDELWSIEERLYSLKQQAREEEETEKKRAAQEEEKRLKDLASLQQQWINAIAQADLDRIRAAQEAEEERARRRIQDLQDELDQLERLWAAEDRRNRLDDLRAQLAEVKADTAYQWVNPETGQVEWTYDRARARELEEQIADAEREDERARIRERLQDQIQAARDELSQMQEAHRTELQERQRFWQAMQEADVAAYADLQQAAEEGLEPWVDVFRTKLGDLQSLWEEKARAIEAAARRISQAYSAAASSSIVTPTLPASIAESTGSQTSVSLGGVNITVNGATDPQATAAAVQTAAQRGTQQGLLDALVLSGRTAVRTGR